MRPTSRTVDSGPFFGVEFDEYCAGFTPEQCVMAGRDLDGAIPRVGLATYSEITRHAWPADGVAALLDQIERHQISPVLEPPCVSGGLQTGKVIIEPVDEVPGRFSPDRIDAAVQARMVKLWLTGGFPGGCDLAGLKIG